MPLTHVFTALQRLRQLVSGDRVLQNSLYLMGSTAVMAAFGFGFWFISARLYSTEQLGLSSTLINSATTLSLLSLLGFDNVLVRYLATSKSPDKVIDTGIIFSGLASVVLSVGFLLALPVVSPSLLGILSSPWHAVFFVVTMLLVTINTLTDSAFIAWQGAKYIMLADTALSVVKVSLPVALVALGAFGIFSGYAASVTVATIISLAVMAKRYNYRFRPVIDRETVREVQHFSTGTYLASLANAVPLMIFPIMATNVLGASSAAFFNLAMTVAALLFIIPRATANSLFAEGAKANGSFRDLFWRTLRHTAVILLPAVAGMMVLAHYVLLVFGPQYAQGSAGPLRIFALSAVVVAFNAVATIVLKVKHRLRALVIIELLSTVLMLAGAWPLMKWLGVDGAALAWLVGQAIMAVMLAVAVLPLVRNDNDAEARA